MSLEEVQQNYADATGLVVDRSVNPPKVLGQAFLISRNRMVTCASVVYNYAEAPWALAVQFIHPDVSVGVRSMVLHPDFDKKAARNWYVAQQGIPGEQLVLNNDIATLTIDLNLAEMPADKIGELNRALSLPFSSAGVETSGNMRGEEFLNILHKVVQSKKFGLLTLFDSRNFPIARIQLTSKGVEKVYYKGLLGELAFFELVYRKPAEGYAFQTEGEGFNWGNVRDITAPTDALVQEALRREREIPAIAQNLGGTGARYQQRIENYDASVNASESIQWFADRLWSCIDGYMPIDKMSERAGADTFTVLQGIREMVNKAHISLINRPPFHQNGIIGTPLTSHTDFEVHAWDPLQSFFLDPVSGKPNWMQGNFMGVSNSLQPKNMLHTIQIPGVVPGAMILKDYKLIGIHSGPHTPKPGQQLPPFQGKIYQMMWMGALLEMSASKKAGREGDASMTGAEAAPSGVAGLRSKSMEDRAGEAPPDKLQKFECPNCHATNTQVGPCFNCGTQIVAPEVPEEEPAKTGMGKALRQVQDKTNLNQKQIVLGGTIAVMLVVLLVVMMSGSSSPPPPTTKAPVTAEHPQSESAMKIAVENAGFKATAIPGYWYEDTSELTKPSPSFGMSSEQANQKLLFVVMDNMGPVDNLESFVGLPPYSNVFRAESGELKNVKVDENKQLIGNGALHWFVGRYNKQEPAAGENPQELILIGGFPSPKPGKSILVIGKSLSKDKHYDYQSSLFLIDHMASDFTAQGNAERTNDPSKKNDLIVSTGTTTATGEPEVEKPIATDAELDSFAKKVEDDIQAKLKLPEDVQEELKKKKSPKGFKSEINVRVNGAGAINKLEITQQADLESMSPALERAINGAAPFKDTPRTKDGNIDLIVTLVRDDIKVSRP